MKKYSKKKKWIAVGMSVVLIGGAAGGIFFRSRSRSFQAMAENVNISEKLELYRDLLMTDLCLRENVKSRPTFARDLSSSKDFVREFFQKEEKTPEHLSGYEGYDSRQMAKMAHLEPLRDGTYLLFDYKKRDPLSYNARTVRV